MRLPCRFVMGVNEEKYDPKTMVRFLILHVRL